LDVPNKDLQIRLSSGLGITHLVGLLIAQTMQVHWELLGSRHQCLVDQHWNDGHRFMLQRERDFLAMDIVRKIETRSVLVVSNG
jgi:hypothetical protein